MSNINSEPQVADHCPITLSLESVQQCRPSLRGRSKNIFGFYLRQELNMVLKSSRRHCRHRIHRPFITEPKGVSMPYCTLSSRINNFSGATVTIYTSAIQKSLNNVGLYDTTIYYIIYYIISLIKRLDFNAKFWNLLDCRLRIHLWTFTVETFM